MNSDDKKRPDEQSTQSFIPSSRENATPKLSRLGCFRIIDTLGSGGMGTVYRAYDESMKRDVALKVLHPSLEFSGQAQARFVREAWIAGKLQHPNIVKVYSRGEENNINYIAMELIDGPSLADNIRGFREHTKSKADITETLTRYYMRSMLEQFAELTSALTEIHKEGFVHRDIKPGNILVSGEEKILKFADFGIAHADDMTKMTKAGDFVGTVKYMSPELLTAHRATVDHRSDIYSLGVSLYEALTLSLPFDGDSEERMISSILAGHAIPARRRNRRLPRDVETVLMKATHYDPDCRYQSARKFGEDIECVLQDRPIKAKRPNALIYASRFITRNKLVASLVLLAVAATFAVSSLVLSQRANEAALGQIYRTLSMAIQAKQSPRDIVEDWEQQWPHLLKYLQQAEQMDSIVESYLKLSTLPFMYTEKYQLRDSATIEIRHINARLFDTSTYFDDGSLPWGVVSQFDVSIDNSEFFGSYHIAENYRSLSAGSVSEFVRFKELTDTIPTGPVKVVLRRISFHYNDVRFFDRPADTLSSSENVDFKRFDRCNCNPIVLCYEDRSPATPLLVDTAYDTSIVYLIDQFPDDLPRIKRVDDAASLIVQAFSFTQLSIGLNSAANSVIRSEPLNSRHRLKYSLIGWLYVMDASSGNVLCSLQAYMSPTMEFAELTIGGTGASGWRIRHWDNYVEFGWGTKLWADSFLNSVIVKSPLNAVVTFRPSRELAKGRGYIYEIYGDTVSWPIVLTAFDSSGSLVEK